ncbi:MAG: glycoside hydrolase family 18 protein [Deltaproteobacteria bacterium]|nr:glycoside hydrolase family 18 protein [Deltaproteobacteria bacterium]
MRAWLACLGLTGCLGLAGELPRTADGGASSTMDAGAADAGHPADAGPPLPEDGGSPKVPPVWVTGYFAGWMHPTLPVSDVDFGAVTHLAHFSYLPREDGTLDTTSLGLTPERSREVVAAAHGAGKKVLLVLGGAWSRDAFRGAMAPAHVDAFVGRIVSAVSGPGYDGVDVDMEPVKDEDAPLFVPFVQKLRAGLDAAAPGLLLTAAVDWNAASFGPVLPHFDQLNLMTYDLAGAWPGWETWHNTPLRNGGLAFASTGEPLPSVETQVARALAGGAPRAKLGVGISFYVYVWNGVSGPNQPLDGVTVEMNKPWSWMMDALYAPSAYRWHDGVDAPYLSLGTGSTARFVSFDDAQSISRKLAWVREQGLGGVILWELGGGYRAGEPAGQRDGLLQAVKAAAFPP